MNSKKQTPAPRIPKILAICLFALFACGVASDPHPQLVVKGLGDAAKVGIFDPSFQRDSDNRLWMSYSTVQPHETFGKAFNGVSTRVAYSDDDGENWTDAGQINAAISQALPWPHNKLNAKWEHEVSRLLYDPFAAQDKRWKILWHRYLRVYDGKSPDSTPLFEHGWMELREAAKPDGPWGPGRKLFVGVGYKKANNNTIGPPEFNLHKLAPGKDRLGRCAAFTEPGMIAREEGIYVALKCATGKPDGQVALLQCSHDFASCDYRGPLLWDQAAAKFGDNLSGFSGTDIFDYSGQAYLIATPTKQPGETYHGCLFFKIDSLADAQIDPQPVLQVHGTAESFNGACGYSGAKSQGGVYFSEYIPAGPDHFRIFKSGKHLP